MNNDLQNKQLNMLTSSVGVISPPVDAGESLAATRGGYSPAAGADSRKLSEGWHTVERLGEIFVSPGGTAWTIQRIGDELKSVSVTLTNDDIIVRTSAEKVKEARRKQVERAKSKVARTKATGLTAGGAGVAAEGVLL